MAQGQNISLLSGRVKKTPSANADPNRYSWLNLQNAEPDLGVPGANGSFFTSTTTGTRSWTSAITASGSQILIQNLAVSGESNLGDAGNVLIYGGNTGQALITDGNGNLSWSTVAGQPGGINTYVQFNNNGNFEGTSTFVFNSSSNTLTVTNVTTTGTANLGSNANVKISGGSNGYVLTTDGSGNLSWSFAAGNSAAPMPYLIPTGNSFVVPSNFQGLFSEPITIDGEFAIDGILIDVGSGAGNTGGNGQYISNGSAEVSTYSGNTNVTITGNLIPTANVTYDLGTTTNRFNDLYLSGSTIYLGASEITSNSTGVSLGDKVNFSDASNVTLGQVSNVHLLGGGAGQVLSTDGTGGLSWITVSGGGGGGGANVTVDTFTGDGSNTTFTLSTTPANENQTTVNYNGATLLRSSYSLSGANIVFSSAPANGAQIEVTTLEQANLSPSSIGNGSSNVTIPIANGNVFMYVAGSERFRATSTGVRVTGQSNLGAVGNVYITGGSNGQALVTDGAGNLSWSNVAGEPGGFNTYVQFNDSGNFAGSARFLFNKVGNTLTVSNVTVSGSGNVLSFTNTAGNSIRFAVPSTIANTTSFIVPNSSGTSQQVLGVTDQATQTLGWKTLPTNYITIELRDSSTYTSSPTPVLRVYPLRLRSGTFIDLPVTQ